MTHSIRKDKPELMKVVANLVLLRTYLPLLDIEGRRFSNSDSENLIFILIIANVLFI